MNVRNYHEADFGNQCQTVKACVYKCGLHFIFWYVVPTIINTFLESYDFTIKTIVLFATSVGSVFDKTVDELKGSVDSTTIIKERKLLNGKQDVNALRDWVTTLGL